MDSSPRYLKIIIVGAGLGGLSAAIACSLSGHSVTVFESAKELLEVGAGLQVTPNASRLLRRWGLPETLWHAAAEPALLTVHRYSDGKILAMENNFAETMRAEYGAPFIDLHRMDLQISLYERAKELGVIFRLGEKVDSIDFSIPSVLTVAGSTAEADLIVAADGLWSRCRECFLNKPDKPTPTGDLAYRLVLNLDEIQDPELREWVSNPKLHFWIGPGAHAVGYSLRAGNMYNIVLLVPDDLPEGVTRQKGSVEEMKALFKDWDPILSRFLDIVQEVDKWKLMHHPEMVSWINDKSNFVLIGDACHPMLPYLAQGASSAIEDGAVLGLLLGKIQCKSQLHQALKLYEQLRKPRGEAIVKATIKQRQLFHMPNGAQQEARDKEFLLLLGNDLIKDCTEKWRWPDIQPWLYGYDAYQEVDSALEKTPFL